MNQERFVIGLTTIGKAVDVYNSAISTLETRLLVSALQPGTAAHLATHLSAI